MTGVSKDHRTITGHGFKAALVCLAMLLAWGTTASAQLDPLLFLKRVPPTVIIVVDTGLRMLEDGTDRYYDPNNYLIADDADVAKALGLTSGIRYRRIYHDLQYENIQDSSTKFVARDITAVADSPSSTFYAPTRLEMVRAGIDAAVSGNAAPAYRWGLIKLRQSEPGWRTAPNCDKPVRITLNDLLANTRDTYPCNVGTNGRFGIYVPSVKAPNYSIEGINALGSILVPAANDTANNVLTIVRRGINIAGGLIPAGMGTSSYGDRPLTHALEDARAAAVAAMDADTDANRVCRNTIVVLLTAGKDDGDPTYLANHDAAATATTFLKVTSKDVTKRVPIHVLAIKPKAVDESDLQSIAKNSGGRYLNVGSAVEIATAINYAVQTGFSRANEFDAGKSSEFLPVSPIVGTVNLKNGKSATGATLPDTDILSIPGNQALPQRSNFMLTAGFALPGFDGVLRAFRVYRPEKDSTKPAGWKFVNDGTPLWPDSEGRGLAGRARVPTHAPRNIYTYIPSGVGTGSVVAFSRDNESILRLHLGPMSGGVTVTAGEVIDRVRAQPLGAVIGSTPAIMDVPSLDPPPDSAYGFADSTGTFAGKYKNRRAMIFFGANDGMIHAVDARTGYEVWAFIPYNLLPKLYRLVDGQSIDQFDYFVDSSPKIAEVKLSGEWRTLLLIGEGPGGTFYQAFDVTEAGMGVAPDQDGLTAVSAVLERFDTPNESITYKWSFPDYSNFEPNFLPFSVTDPDSKAVTRFYGDLKSSASQAEKTVGFTWSDPAVGPLDLARTTTAVIVGSGYFPDEKLVPSRGATATKAGNAFYLLNADTGRLLGGSTACTAVSSGSGSGTGCVSIGDTNNGRKNALQADPTAAGDAGSTVVNKAYLGDIDGRYWRFDFTAAGSISASEMVDTSQPIYSSSALLFIGTAHVYMFFATGSDLLPSGAPGGANTFKLYGLRDNAPGAGATVQFEQNLVKTTDSNGVPVGERPSTSPSVAGDIVFFTTTLSTSDPCSDFSAKLYAMTYAGGAAYDSNDNGKIDKTESPVVSTFAGRATAPFIVDQHLYVGTSGATGANIEAFGDPQDFNNGVGQVGVRILSWREIR